MRKLLVVFLVVSVLVWAVPTVALAQDASGVVGVTSAEVDFNAPTAHADATAAGSLISGGELVGYVEANAPAGPPYDEYDGPVQVNNGGGSTTTVYDDPSDPETTAEARVGDDGPFAEGRETLGEPDHEDSIVITAPAGLSLGTGEPLEVLVAMDTSYGHSIICHDTDQGVDYIGAHSHHDVGPYDTVYLFDETIYFAAGHASASSQLYQPGGFKANAYAEINELYVRDGGGYQSFGNLFNDTDNPQDHSTTLAEINTLLVPYNLEIMLLLHVFAEADANGADANAALMLIVLKDGLGNSLIDVGLCLVSSSLDYDGAIAEGFEVAFAAYEPEEPQGLPDEPPPEEPQQPQGTPEEPQEAQEIPTEIPTEAPAEAPAVTTTEQGELPVTGANLIGMGLLAISLIGTGITLRRKYGYKPKH